MYLLWLVLLSLLTFTGTKYVPDLTGTDIEIPSYSQLLQWFPIAGQEMFQHPIPVLSHKNFIKLQIQRTVQSSSSVIFTRCVQNTHQSINYKDFQEEEYCMSSTSESGGDFN